MTPGGAIHRHTSMQEVLREQCREGKEKCPGEAEPPAPALPPRNTEPSRCSLYRTLFLREKLKNEMSVERAGRKLHSLPCLSPHLLLPCTSRRPHLLGGEIIPTLPNSLISPLPEGLRRTQPSDSWNRGVRLAGHSQEPAGTDGFI